MRMLEIQDSSNVQAVGYSPGEQHLVVKFRNGGCYRYDQVPPSLFAHLVSAASVGKHLDAHVKQYPAMFPYQRLDGPPSDDLAEGQMVDVTISCRAKVLQTQDEGHGKCYKLELEKRDFSERRYVWVDASELRYK